MAAVDRAAAEPVVDDWLSQPAGGVHPNVHVVGAAESSAADFAATEPED